LSKSIKINGLKKDSFNEDGFLPSYTSQAIWALSNDWSWNLGFKL
jgi:hypothetical protein